VELNEIDKTPLGAKAWPAFRTALAIAVVGLIVAVASSFIGGEDAGIIGGKADRLSFAYLIAYCFVIAITIGSTALVVLTHLFRAGWVVAVRRVPETFAANFLWVALLGLPLIIFAFDSERGKVYPWAMNEAALQERVDKADEVLGHGHGHHAEAETQAGDAYYAPGRAAESDQDGRVVRASTAGPGEDPVNAAATRPGEAYPEDRAQARAEQEARYTSLLAYMLDYKRFGGQFQGDALVPLEPLKENEKLEDHERRGMGFLWYTPLLFILRVVIYFAMLFVVGQFFWRNSIKQDETGDAALTTKREWWSPVMTITFAFATTFIAFDLIMSLDPAWYSTMFGVIYFANSFLAGIAVTILTCMMLQRAGFLKVVNVEHYHDLGKLLFAMTFFWGYVSFSQFMLIWYASLPETTYWMELHGMTTVKTAPQYGTGWSWISLLLLFGHLIVPFGFLLSRHVKRNMTCLAIAALWMVSMVYVDIYWYIMPFFKSPQVTFGLPEIGMLVFMTAVIVALFIRRYARHAPVAHGDPRLHESIALDTSAWAPIHH